MRLKVKNKGSKVLLRRYENALRKQMMKLGVKPSDIDIVHCGNIKRMESKNGN